MNLNKKIEKIINNAKLMLELILTLSFKVIIKLKDMKWSELLFSINNPINGKKTPMPNSSKKANKINKKIT